MDVIIDTKKYVEEIASARTIAFTQELEMLAKMGLGKGGTIENVVVYDEKTCLSKLRFDDELVRHKILDILGDISLIGTPVQGHFIAVKSSHKLNNLLAHEIYNEIN
jgi:UDP-3-O-[3-hydroxymyristoyl] N-acetylglucosamine deacetylase